MEPMDLFCVQQLEKGVRNLPDTFPVSMPPRLDFTADFSYPVLDRP